jgi:dihydropteroate synthase
MTLNCNGKLIDITTPKVMGILNCTPDSFYDGGQWNSDAIILRHVEKMLHEGATFIDVGGYSSRPNAQHISEEEELKRVMPILKMLVKEFSDILLSIDTFRSKVATESIAAGACMVNDISAGTMDADMFSTIARLQVPYIIMHMQGAPQNMQYNPTYNDIVYELIQYFSEKIYQLRKLGVNDIIIDVGFGFGKTIAQNYTLLKELALFKNLELPLLTGISRKSMLYKLLETTPDKALNATTVANTIALLNGADILRVHDVKEACEAVKIVQFLKEA